MKRLSLLTASLLALLFVACQPAPLTVMSFNVRNSAASDGPNDWELRKSATGAMLAAVRPDVFGVQEALPDQIDYILEAAPAYQCYGIGRNDGVEGERMSIFYNTERMQMEDHGTWWLSETPDVPSKGWDAKYPRTATWALLSDLRTGRQLYFVDTHLDHRGVQARREGLLMIVNKVREMNPDVPMVLLGDFNVEPGDSALLALDGLMLSVRTTARKTTDEPSFNGFGLSDATLIDYIYYSGFKDVREFRVVNETFDEKPYISDHYPIVAKLDY